MWALSGDPPLSCSHTVRRLQDYAYERTYGDVVSFCLVVVVCACGSSSWWDASARVGWTRED